MLSFEMGLLISLAINCFREDLTIQFMKSEIEKCHENVMEGLMILLPRSKTMPGDRFNNRS